MKSAQINYGPSAVTPSRYREKFTKMAQQLSELSAHTNDSKGSLVDELEKLVIQFEANFPQAIIEYNKKVNSLKDDFLKTQKLIEADNKFFEDQMN